MVIKYNEISKDTKYLNINDAKVNKQQKIIQNNKKQEEKKKEIERQKSDSVSISKKGKNLSLNASFIENDKIKSLNGRKEEIKEQMKEYEERAREQGIDPEIIKEQKKIFEEQITDVDKKILEEKQLILDKKAEKAKEVSDKINKATASNSDSDKRTKKQNEKANAINNQLLGIAVSYDSAIERSNSLAELATREDIAAKSYEKTDAFDGDTEEYDKHKAKANELRDMSVQELAKGYREINEIAEDDFNEVNDIEDTNKKEINNKNITEVENEKRDNEEEV